MDPTYLLRLAGKSGLTPFPRGPIVEWAAAKERGGRGREEWKCTHHLTAGMAMAGDRVGVLESPGLTFSSVVDGFTIVNFRKFL